jgi:hypothetical protein
LSGRLQFMKKTAFEENKKGIHCGKENKSPAKS